MMKKILIASFFIFCLISFAVAKTKKLALEGVIKRAKLKKVNPRTLYFSLMSHIAVMSGLPRSWVLNYHFKRPIQYIQEQNRGRPISNAQAAVQLVLAFMNGHSTLLKELPGKYIASVTVYKDRIYYLCGTKNGFPNVPSLFSMHSCRFDGSNRKTLFSSQRLNRVHELDHITSATVSTFIALPDGDSLFAVSKMNLFGKIYRFNPKDESFVLISDPKKEHIVNLFDHGDFILGQEGRSFGESYFLMDKRTLRREYFFTQNIRDKGVHTNTEFQVTIASEMQSDCLKSAIWSMVRELMDADSLTYMI